MDDPREKMLGEVLRAPSDNLLLELATGTGKSRLALEKVNQWMTEESRILIVVPRLVLVENWKKEREKWGMSHMLPKAMFSTFLSLHKQSVEQDIVVIDEVHHLSERCMGILSKWKTNKCIFLSATIKDNLKSYLKYRFHVCHLKVHTWEAIDTGILPPPKIYLLPLQLDNKRKYCEIIRNPNGKLPVLKCTWENRWNYFKQTVHKVSCSCTEKQYYEHLSSYITFLKTRGRTQAFLSQSRQRLLWLATIKTKYVQGMLKKFSKDRVLVFCPSIEQSGEIGNCVNSKDGTGNLDRFNRGEINLISAVGMLDEGCNLVDCNVGIFNMLNSSERLNVQRFGRLLRHPSPIIVIPYYANTREEEIARSIVSEYDKDLVYEIKELNEIK